MRCVNVLITCGVRLRGGADIKHLVLMWPITDLWKMSRVGVAWMRRGWHGGGESLPQAVSPRERSSGPDSYMLVGAGQCAETPEPQPACSVDEREHPAR